MAARPYSRQFKVCLIGDGYVGKTSIRRRYLGKVFKSSYIATIGVDFAQKSLTIDGGQALLVIWDIAGQPLWQGLRKRYYEGASGIVLVYSVVERASFDNASKWLVEAHGFMQRLPPLIIIGNKIDLRPNLPPQETVTHEEGVAFTQKFSESLNTPAVFIETSAATGEMIDEAFDTLTKMMIETANRRLPAYAQRAKIPIVQATPALQPTVAPQSAPPPSTLVRPVVSSPAAVRTEPVPEQKQPPAPAMPSGDVTPSKATQFMEKQTGLPAESSLGAEPTITASKIPVGEGVTEKPPLSPPSPAAAPAPAAAAHGEVVPATIVSPTTEYIPEVDAFLSFVTDSAALQDSQVKETVAELMNLQRELKKAEADLAITTSALDADLLNLRNSVHVKRMMYEALQQQIRLIRQEWADAYEAYQKTDHRKKTETEGRDRQIDDLKKRIERAKESIEKRVRELEKKGPVH